MVDTNSYLITAPNGDVIPLNVSAFEDGDFAMLADTEGFGFADRDVRLATSVGDGGTLRAVRTPSRTGVISVLVHGGDQTTLRANFKRLNAAIRFVRGLPLPRLTVIYDSGESYSIPFLYESGVDTGTRFLDGIKAPLNVIFPDPFWTADAPGQFSVVQNTQANVGLLPDLAAMNLAPTGASGHITVTNDGDAPAQVVWTITGPETLVTVTNQLGESWSFGPVSAGEVITISTIDNTATLANGTNVYSRFGSAPKLFPLPAGDNDIQVVLTGTTAASLVTGYFSPRLESIV